MPGLAAEQLLAYAAVEHAVYCVVLRKNIASACIAVVAVRGQSVCPVSMTASAEIEPSFASAYLLDWLTGWSKDSQHLQLSRCPSVQDAYILTED